jgi:cytidylate kinase
MGERRSIAISGDLGSGKSTIAAGLSRRLGLRIVSMGGIYREMAQARGLTALQLNQRAERDEEIDARVDRTQREMAASAEPLIVDSRLGWHFFTEAFKVHLIVDPEVAARRVLSRPADGVESYNSIEEAGRRLRERSESERARFIVKYGVDKSRLRNYSMVCDTTRVTPEEAAERIIAAFDRFPDEADDAGASDASKPLLLLDPARVHVGRETESESAGSESAGPESVGAASAGSGPARITEDIVRVEDSVDVCCTDSRFSLVDGHERLRSALQAGERLIRARLIAD